MEADTADLGLLRQKTHLLLEKLKLNQNRVKEALHDTLNGSVNDVQLVREGPRSRQARNKLTDSKSERRDLPFSKKTDKGGSPGYSRLSYSKHHDHHVINPNDSNPKARDTRERLCQGKRVEGQGSKVERSPRRVPVSVVRDTVARSDGKIVYHKGTPGTPRSNNVSFTESPVISNGHASTPPNCRETVSVISERTRTSTPKQQTTVSKTDTPKSILKHRKMIDDHIKVDSKYSHPDIVGHNPKRIQLNFSYSDDPLKTPQGMNPSPGSGGSKSPYTKNLDGSYIEEYLEDDPLGEPSHTSASQLGNSLKKAGTATQVLLNDIGNDRKHAEVAREISRRKKSDIFQSANQVLDEQDERSKLVTRSPKMKSLLHDRAPPLLGYDWIAGLLENDPKAMDKSETFFEDLREFRRSYKDECSSKIMPSKMIQSPAVVDDSTEIRDPAHTCIHGYTLNDRLFTYPVNVDEQGRSICPICVTSRAEPTKEDPGFVRVSIPRSSLQTPYTIKPHRRRSFDDTDSCALSKHCVAGWECSKPSMLPSAKGLDLNQEKNKIYKQLGTTVTDAQIFADAQSRQAKLANDAILHRQQTKALQQIDPSHREPPLNGIDPATQQSRLTDDLLDLSYSFRYNLQNLEKDRGLTRNIAAHSTSYPLL